MKNLKRITTLFLAFVLFLSLVSCNKDEIETPKGMQLAQSDFVDYYLFVPEEWVVDATSGYISAYHPQDKSNISLLTMTGTKAYSSIDEYVEEYCAELASTFTNYEYIESESLIGGVNFGGKDAARIVYKITVGENVYKYMQVVTASGYYVYTMTYSALEENYETHIEEVFEVINNFKLK